MNRIAYSLILAVSLIIIAGSCSENRTGTDPWPEITKQVKPWTRWWWLGSDVDETNITKLLAQYSESGIGGVEITPIYGVKGREDSYLEFLSPTWMDMLKTSVSEAERLGMGVDMNLGTGWPFGGPQITPDIAASRLVIQKFSLSGNERLDERILPSDPRQARPGTKLEALMAYSADGRVLDLTERVDEEDLLDWVAEEGEWELYAAFCGKTGQQVKRAAPGGEGFTMDHLSESALDTYLERFEEAFNGYRGVRCFFNDSYEVYHASWTPGFFGEFSTRRGYDLRGYLRELSGEAEGEATARVKSDYRETMSELLLEKFTRPWSDWSKGMGSLTRNQAHGSPGNLIDLYAAVDIPECEIFGHRNFDIPGLKENTDDTRNVEPNPMMLKLATSAANVTGKPLVSNETFTWLGEHFKVALSQCKPEVEDAFIAGINHVFYHGSTYSPDDAPWPGWLFYASVNFAPSNSSWPHLEALNTYIARCQSILQSGRADNEVMVYWPVYDLWHDHEGLDMQLTVHNIMEWLDYPAAEQMSAGGYSYDFISDALLNEFESDGGALSSPDGKVRYDALVVPACSYMPLETLSKILELAEQGSTVIFQEFPGDVPGLHELESRREAFKQTIDGLEFLDTGKEIFKCETGEGMVLLGGEIGKTLAYAGINGEKISGHGLKFIRRELKDGKYYYLVNHSADAVDEMIPINCEASSVLMLDPQDGSFGKADTRKDSSETCVRIQLKPGESVFLRTFENGECDADPWLYEESRSEAMVLGGNWKLDFVEGGPELPKSIQMEELMPWTEMEDTLMNNFSGSAVYSLSFTMPELTADEYILNLGQVYESARVYLNGEDLGICWSVPFELKAGSFLKEGENTLEIEISNLMANRIRYMDRQGISWRNFHEINFVNIEYQPFDASAWKVQPSGLKGPVRLIPVQKGKQTGDI
jgi:hypothetical protein